MTKPTTPDQIANQSAFPNSSYEPRGMTYRQWLCGQIIGPLLASSWAQHDPASVSTEVVRQADALIALLAQEK